MLHYSYNITLLPKANIFLLLFLYFVFILIKHLETRFTYKVNKYHINAQKYRNQKI